MTLKEYNDQTFRSDLSLLFRGFEPQEHANILAGAFFKPEIRPDSLRFCKQVCRDSDPAWAGVQPASYGGPPFRKQ